MGSGSKSVFAGYTVSRALACSCTRRTVNGRERCATLGGMLLAQRVVACSTRIQNTTRQEMGYMTEERLMIQEQARKFAMNEVLPIANKLDPIKGDIPMELRQKMAELGYFGITIPEQYGGLGLGYFEYCLIVEELSRAWMSVASLLARGNSLPGSELWPDEKRRFFLSRMAKGEFL